MTETDLRKLTISDFEARKDENFTLLHAQIGERQLLLKEVRPLGESGRPGGAFSLGFVTPAGQILPQAIYALTHPQMGRLEIFLVPLGPSGCGNLYELIFT